MSIKNEDTSPAQPTDATVMLEIEPERFVTVAARIVASVGAGMPRVELPGDTGVLIRLDAQRLLAIEWLVSGPSGSTPVVSGGPPGQSSGTTPPSGGG